VEPMLSALTLLAASPAPAKKTTLETRTKDVLVSATLEFPLILELTKT